MPKLFKTTLPIVLLSAAMASHASFDLCPAPTQSNDDIISKEATTEELHQAMLAANKSADLYFDWVEDKGSNACNGYYAEPFNPSHQQFLDEGQADSFLSAESVNQYADGSLSLTGNVELYQGSRRLSCSQLLYQPESQRYQLSGNIKIRDKGLLLMAESAELDDAAAYSELNQAKYLMHEQHIRGQSKKIEINGANDNALIDLYDTSFTVCPETSEHWSFYAKSLELDKEKGWGTLRRGVFKAGKVPIIYIPYLNFPLDDRRKTGVLWPTISGGRHYVDIALPIYFNIAPQFDMTYTPRVLNTHGYLHNIETRYKQRYSDWVLTGSYIDRDKRVHNEQTRKNPELDKQRWLGALQQKGRFNANWSTSIDYTAVSDIHYFRDWGTTGLDVQKSLNIKRSATLNYQDSDWSFKAQVVDYDKLEEDPNTGRRKPEDYRLWPQLSLTYNDKQRHLTLEPVFETQYSYFDHQTRLKGSRLYAAPGISFPMRWQAIEVIPTAKLKTTEYLLRNEQIAAGESRTQGIRIPTFSLDAKMHFDRFDGDSTSTLTPRLFYYYAHYRKQDHLPNFDTSILDFSYQQLWREGRMSSYDRIDDANQVSLGLENSWAKQGRTFFDVGIGQTYYLQDRRNSPRPNDRNISDITGNESHAALKRKKQLNHQIDKSYYRHSSDIAAQSNWYPAEFHSIRSSLHYDHYDDRISETALAYHFANDQRFIANLGYRYQFQPQMVYADDNGKQTSFRRTVQQVDGSFYLPVSRQWDLYASSQYDLSHSEFIENIVGAKYEGCCWGVMLAYKRERKTFSGNSRITEGSRSEYKNYWFIQFELKGLGGISDVISRLLKERIQGFNND